MLMFWCWFMFTGRYQSSITQNLPGFNTHCINGMCLLTANVCNMRQARINSKNWMQKKKIGSSNSRNIFVLWTHVGNSDIGCAKWYWDSKSSSKKIHWRTHSGSWSFFLTILKQKLVIIPEICNYLLILILCIW